MFSERKPCTHGAILPKGLVCDRGYLSIRLFNKKQALPRKSVGKHTPQNQKLAVVLLNRLNEKRILNKLDIEIEQPSITINQALDIYTNFGEVSKNNLGVIKRILRPAFGEYKFDELKAARIISWREKREKDVDPRTGNQIKFSTVNREQTLLQSMYSDLIRWRKIEKPGLPDYKIPSENPCKLVSKPSEKDLARERIPSNEEMSTAKDWCLTNDPELWNAVAQSIVTMLRKTDFKKIIDNGKTEGIQGKTGKKFKVRASFPNPINLTNWRKRWETLQRAMGWTEYLENGEPNPSHTVWHDLRHWGPTFLGEKGYGNLLIQKLTGHSTEEMVLRYTNLREAKIQEAVNLLQTELNSL